MKWSLRTRLLATFLVLVAVVGAVTLFAIERTLAGDLLKSLDARLVYQGRGVASWLDSGDRSSDGGGGGGVPSSDEAKRIDRIATRLGGVIGARITIIGADGAVEGDSSGTLPLGSKIENAPELAAARVQQVGRAERSLVSGQPP